MAVIKNGILGGVSGKVGNVIGVSSQGSNYLRAIPTSHNDAKSPKQVANRMKFALCTRFLSSAKSFVRIGFKGASTKNSFGAAVSYNYKTALQGEYPDISLDYSKVALSRGSLTGLYETSLTATENHTLKVTWQNNAKEGTAQASDTIMTLVYEPENDEVVFSINAGTRDGDEANITVPQHFTGKTVHCWVAVLDAEMMYNISKAKESVSNSTYVGETTII